MCHSVLCDSQFSGSFNLWVRLCKVSYVTTQWYSFYIKGSVRAVSQGLAHLAGKCSTTDLYP